MGARTQEAADYRGEKPQKVDPSVSELDLYKRGEPRGSVPLSKTMEKPLAYRSPSRQKEPKDSNP